MNRESCLTALDIQRLQEVDPTLRRIVVEASRYMVFRVTCGHRGKAEQDAAVAAGKSKTPWPTSAHNSLPSRAVDLVPLEGTRIDWSDRERMTYLGGLVRGIGAALGVSVRWGGDWDGDGEVKDNNFDDLPHFEIAKTA